MMQQGNAMEDDHSSYKNLEKVKGLIDMTLTEGSCHRVISLTSHREEKNRNKKEKFHIFLVLILAGNIAI